MNFSFQRAHLLFGGLALFCNTLLGQTEESVSIPAYPDSIHGTLLRANSSNGKTLCIIHAGSGPTDRNGNSALAENNSLKKLANFLWSKNISSFRFDKRGVEMSRHALEREDSLTMDVYVNDLANIIEHFSDERTGFKEILLIGHSEGALISTLAVRQNPRVSGLILLAGAGYRADTILKKQLSFIQADAKEIIFSIIDSLAKGKRVENIPPVLSSLFRESLQSYMISWMKYDPAAELAKLKLPVLIIQGQNDIQVSEDNAQRLKENCKNCRMVIVKGMNHILVRSPSDKEANKKTYNDPEIPLHPLLLKELEGFIANPSSFSK